MTALTRAGGTGLLLIALAAPAADAAPASPTCRLVRDAAGDVTEDLTAKVRSGPPSEALDILGGDIAADGRALTVIIQVAGPVQADSYSPTGFGYSFRFTVDAGDKPQLFELNADIGPTSANYSLFRSDDNAGFSGVGMYVRGKLDSTKKQIRVTADMTQLQSMAAGALQHPEGHTLRDFKILSGTSTGEQSHAYVNAMGDDVAESNEATKIGAASCVTPG